MSRAHGTDTNRRRTQAKPVLHKWEVYPDYWKESWGVKPLLGVVEAEDQPSAVGLAYSKKLLPTNDTFGPHVVCVGRVSNWSQ